MENRVNRISLYQRGKGKQKGNGGGKSAQFSHSVLLSNSLQ
jgi:hypothetical protein